MYVMLCMQILIFFYKQVELSYSMPKETAKKYIIILSFTVKRLKKELRIQTGIHQNIKQWI